MQEQTKANFYGLQVVEFYVEGVSPLLMNNPLSMGTTSGSLKTKTIPTPEEEAYSKLYRNDDGTLYLPTIAFRSALLSGAKGRRVGKQAATTLLTGSVFAADSRTPLVHPDTREPLTDDPENWRINTARVMVQKNGIMRSRPELPEWAAIVSFALDIELVPNPQMIADILNMGGRTAGVGDWRPEKKGFNGRFVALLCEGGA
jgi:hypothetical protein